MYKLTVGTQVRGATGAHVRRFLPGFPGWGAHNAHEFIVDIPAGLFGRVIDIESHGHAPYTRYTVKFEDDSFASGLEWGRDFVVLKSA